MPGKEIPELRYADLLLGIETAILLVARSIDHHFIMVCDGEHEGPRCTDPECWHRQGAIDSTRLQHLRDGG